MQFAYQAAGVHQYGLVHSPVPETQTGGEGHLHLANQLARLKSHILDAPKGPFKDYKNICRGDACSAHQSKHEEEQVHDLHLQLTDKPCQPW